MRNRGATTELTGWALVLVGTLLAIATGRQVANLFAAEDAWAETPATVIRTRISQTDGITGAASNSPRVYQELVYFVDGNRYQGSLEIGRFENREAAAAFLKSAEAPGAKISVWVRVGSPDRIQRTATQQATSAGGITVFALLGLFSLQAGGSLIRSAGHKSNVASAVHVRPITSH